MNLAPYFYASQRAWINDDSPLKLAVKSRQIGFSYCNAYRLVRQVSLDTARLDAFISSRDQFQAKLQLEDCLKWAKLMRIAACDLGELLFDPGTNSSAYVLQFANRRRIYSLSSNPNALAGKRGHVTLDEFALHKDQRLLYRVAKPVTTWGGQLSITSTHRGVGTLFYQLVQDAKNGNPMRWSLHEVPIQKAVAEGIVERINKKAGAYEPRDAFLKRLRAECIDQEQWDQEYCCIPADESSAFFSYDLLASCTDPNLHLLPLDEFLHRYQSLSSSSSSSISASLLPSDERGATGEGSSSPLSTRPSPLYIGLDVARHHDLCVIDLGEKIGSLTYDRLRLELLDQPFSQIEAQLYPLLALPQVKRACIDQTGLGDQLAERAREKFGWKVEPINFTPAIKEQLAFSLRHEFEDCRLRIPADDKLRADLRGLKKELTPSGKLRFIGDSDDSHCDRTWAKALRQHAARRRPSAGAILI
jgi:phage FluMu gp28-like protein